MTDPTLDLAEATRRLIQTADGLDDAAYAEPSGLPDWTRGHVLAHLALNAEGLARALRGVVEGTRVTMYASNEARDADIDELGTAAPEVLRSRLLGGCTDFADAVAAVPADALDSTIDRVPGGRTFTVGDVPGMRLREVEIHHADLAAGYGPADWTPEFCAYVFDTIGPRLDASSSFSVAPSDLSGTWEYGAGGPVVSGIASDIAWWLTGRGAGAGLTADGGDLPRIGAL
jgi:maleylpyruvate isomerase